MATAINILMISIFLCTNSYTDASDDLVVTKRAEFFVDENAKIFHTRNIPRNDSVFVFAVCDDKNLPDMIDCRVNVRTDSVSDPSSAKVCKLHLAPSSDRKILDETYPLEIEFLGKTKRIIVSWFEMKQDYSIIYKKTLIIDTSDCLIKHLSPDLPSDNGRYYAINTNVIAYKDTFDVIIVDRRSSGSSKYRITYDRDGKQISKNPIPFPTTLHWFKTTPLSSSSPSQGFFVFGEMASGAEPSRAEFVTESGLRKAMVTNVQGRLKSMFYSISTLHNITTLCSVHRRLLWSGMSDGVSSVYCEQFKYGVMRPMLNTTFEYTSRSIGAVAVHSLAKGGFLLLTLDCSNNFSPTCAGLTLEKFRSDREQVTIRRIKSLSIECSENLSSIKVDIDEQIGQYCIYISCTLRSLFNDDLVKKTLNYHKICFPKSRENKSVGARKKRSKTQDSRNSLGGSPKKPLNNEIL